MSYLSRLSHGFVRNSFAILLLAINSFSYADTPQFISIGTGGVTGVYYPAGGAICRLMNAGRKQHNIRCSTESTAGSIENINGIKNHEFEFGIAQSDWQFHAFNGSSTFQEKGPMPELRSVFALHSEPVTVIARDDSKIDNLTDFKGKRINIGNKGSGAHATWEIIENALDWKRSDLAFASELKSAVIAQALCDDDIDAFLWPVGHPSASTKEAIRSCASHLVNVKNPTIDNLIKENPYYRYAVIPANMYNNNEDIHTFGVSATVITHADTSDNVVYTLVKSVFDNLKKFKKLHPAFSNLKSHEMISGSLSAPLHPGAIKYYKERGWM